MDSANLASSVRSVIGALHKGLRRPGRTIGSFSMTEIETISLLFRHQHMLPTELAAHTRVKTQSMSQILRNLEEHGLVQRQPSDADKRKIIVTLTKKGMQMVEQTRYEKDLWLKERLDTLLSEREKKLLEQALTVLHKLAAFD